MKIEAQKGIIIARGSTESQDIQPQILSCRRYAEGSEIEVLEVIGIEGESAFKENRPEFNKVLQKVEEYNEPIALILDTVDRLTRNFRSYEKIERLRKKGKIELHTADEKFKPLHKLSIPDDECDWEGEVLKSKLYAAKIAKNMLRKWRLKLSQGHYPGYTPTGYLNSFREGNGEIEKVIKKDPIRAPLIKTAFELCAAGDGIEELTRLMRSEGLTIKPKKKIARDNCRPLTKKDMLWILRNKFYTGMFHWINPDTRKKEEYVAKNYEALISEELFKKVQKILAEKTIKYSTRQSTTKFFKFRGLIKCGWCGCTLTPDNMASAYAYGKKKPPKVYYRCSYAKKSGDPDWYEKKFGTDHSGVIRNKAGKIRHNNCPQKFWTETEIEEQIKDALKIPHYDEEAFQELKTMLSKELETQIQLSEVQKRNLKRKLGEKERLKKRLIDKMVLADFADVALEMRERLEEVKRDVDKIKEEISVLEEMEDAQTDELVDTLSLCSNLSAQYENLSDMKKRELVMLAFGGIRAMKGWVRYDNEPLRRHGIGLDFWWNEPFKSLFEIGFEKVVRKSNEKHRKERHWAKKKDVIKSKKTICLPPS